MTDRILEVIVWLSIALNCLIIGTIFGAAIAGIVHV